MTVNHTHPLFESGVYYAARRRPTQGDLTVDLSHFTKMDSLLGKLGKALHFPEWYGENLDALYDCLSMPEWPENPCPTTIHITGLTHFSRQHALEFQALVDVLTAAMATRQAENASPIQLLLDVKHADLPPWPPQS